MESILSYQGDSDENTSDSDEVKNIANDLTSHLKPVDKTYSISNQIALNTAPTVVSTVFNFAVTFQLVGGGYNANKTTQVGYKGL